MRYKLLALGALVVGYAGGILFGYRAAVVDYVENEARTIESMADTMYEGFSVEAMPEGLEQMMEQNTDSDGVEASDGSKGFQ